MSNKVNCPNLRLVLQSLGDLHDTINFWMQHHDLGISHYSLDQGLDILDSRVNEDEMNGVWNKERLSWVGHKKLLKLAYWFYAAGNQVLWFALFS
ncbi:MAG: hypothetical protein RMX68_024570 [Aulosira sp. ZfuVER01]|nr:hypothetical protein [Aulosira sp. ZfuVER01]MDZ8001733.1 hypothetical protein [Aulosira sp. DedVER01a]MDZ8054711.1 hypothetical protein [Aulosira sp. ZfuCHP01]